MTIYSHSKLSTFQQCRFQYKLKYIDRIKVDVKTTIEAFVGNLVHETLEKLYKDLGFHKHNSKKEIIDFYYGLWDEKYTEDILIANKEYSAQNYKDRGVKFILDYYEHYKPFDKERIIGLETQDMLDLNKNHKYHVRIDKLTCDKEGNYSVCDYKTNNSFKTQEEADKDRQLAMYSLWVKNTFPDAKSIKLVWYMLAFDKKVTSTRTEEKLLDLKKEVEELIEKIENCKDFPVTVTALCGWCLYKDLCPSFKHKSDLEEKNNLKKYMAKDGLIMTDSLENLILEKEKIESRINEVKSNLIDFAKQSKINVVFGSNKKASVREYDKIIYPSDKKEIVDAIKKKGLYEELSGINYLKLNSRIIKKEIDEDIIKMTKKEKNYRVFLSKTE